MKYHIIFITGFFLIILPFIGIPTSWKMAIIGIIGAFLMIVSLIKYYSIYSAEELNQSHADSDPEDRSNNDAVEEPDEVEEEKPQPSPFYNYKKDKVEERVAMDNEEEISAEDDDEDESYLEKNVYEEENAF